MALQFWGDECGSDGQRIITVAGFHGPADRWAAFADEWQRMLDGPPSIPVFKMADAVSEKPTGVFFRFTADQREARIHQAVDILTAYPFVALYAAMDVAAYAELWKPTNASRDMDAAYFHTFQLCNLALGHDLVERGQKEQVEITYDDHPTMLEKVKRWYPLARRIARPEVQAVMPVDVHFGNDEKYKPLQAADILARMTRDVFLGDGSRVAWVWEQMRGKMEFSPRCLRLNAPSIQALMNREPPPGDPQLAAEVARLARLRPPR